MKKYAGAYSTYMKSGPSGDSSQSDSVELLSSFNASDDSAGDYAKYMKQYAGDYSKYADAQEGSNGYAGTYMPQVHNKSDPKEWRDAYSQKYAGAYMPTV